MTRGKRLLLAAFTAASAGAVTAWYFRDTREEEHRRLAALLGWSEGRTVGEIGAGDGRMAIHTAEHVGASGLMFASEIDPKRLANLRRKIGKRQIGNLTVIDAGDSDSNMPANSFDAIYMRGVYHHFRDAAAIDTSVLHALKPGGLLAVIDFPPSRFLSAFVPVQGVPANRGGHGIPQDVLMAELQEAGFDLVDRLNDWPGNNYCVVFRKPN